MTPHALIELVRSWVPSLPLLAVFLDTAGLPLPLPPEVLLIVVGSFAAGGLMPLPLTLVLAALAGIAGDHAGFLLGRRIGRRVTRGRAREFPRPGSAWRYAGVLVQRFGALALPAIRFVPGLRTVAVVLAGAAGVNYRSFLVADAIGTATWSTAYVLLGFSLGPTWYETAAARVGPEGLLILLGLMLAGLIPWAYRQRHRLARFGGPRRVLGRGRNAASGAR